MKWLDAMRILLRGPRGTSATDTSWFGESTGPETGGAAASSATLIGGTSMLAAKDQVFYPAAEVERLQKRIEELLADNDRMSGELWASQIAVRVLAERIAELEEA